MNDPFLDAPPRLRLTLAVVFAVITLGAAADLVMDRPSTVWSLHVMFELGLVLFSLGAATFLAAGWYAAHRELDVLQRSAEETRQERDAWRAHAARLRADLAEAIREQFDTWRLTAAERETALMLLKGYSHKRIARLTSRSDRTVRQHAVAVYRKAGLGGRSELSAYFLEDLLPTDGAGSDGSPTTPTTPGDPAPESPPPAGPAAPRAR